MASHHPLTKLMAFLIRKYEQSSPNPGLNPRGKVDKKREMHFKYKYLVKKNEMIFKI